MKKTLMALAVAASAVVSGSAMAAGWEQNGTGGSVDLGGTLTPVEKVTPWEVKVGDTVTDLNAQIQKGQKEVSISVNKPIPVLGIRTASNIAFIGQPGISPNIDFSGAIDTNAFNNGKTNLTLSISDKDSGNDIGEMETKLTAGAGYSWSDPNNYGQGEYFSLGGINQTHELFNGDLSRTVSGAMNGLVVDSIANAIFPGVKDKFDYQGIPVQEKVYWTGVLDVDSKHSAYYFSGINSDDVIKLTLKQAAQGDSQINWKASLPITVSYQ